VPLKYESFKVFTIVRAVPSASIAPFTVTLIPAIRAPSSPAARLSAADPVIDAGKAAAIAAPDTAADTPPPLVTVDPLPPETLGTLIFGTCDVAVTLGTETVGTLIVGAEIFDTLGKNGTEL
jgi:hypothetical protein